MFLLQQNCYKTKSNLTGRSKDLFDKLEYKMYTQKRMNICPPQLFAQTV